jgi:hypothetical protein
MSIETRLAELGVILPDAPAPAANYVPFVISGNQVYVSGQISANAQGPIKGKLGADMAVEAGAEAAKAWIFWSQRWMRPAAMRARRFRRRLCPLVSRSRSKRSSRSADAGLCSFGAGRGAARQPATAAGCASRIS